MGQDMQARILPGLDHVQNGLAPPPPAVRSVFEALEELARIAVDDAGDAPLRFERRLARTVHGNAFDGQAEGAPPACPPRVGSRRSRRRRPRTAFRRNGARCRGRASRSLEASRRFRALGGCRNPFARARNTSIGRPRSIRARPSRALRSDRSRCRAAK